MDYTRVMAGFTKLFSSIIHSTIWREDMHVKVVWITMLAMADRQGRVQSSLPGLADASRVSLEQCIDALTRLSSPDPYSRTKENEGRRIAEIDGGWSILNYSKYREMRDVVERRIQVKEAVRRHRAKTSHLITVSQGKPRKAQAEAEAEAEAEEKRTTKTFAHAALNGFDAFWEAYPRKLAKEPARKAWEKSGCAAHAEEIVRSIAGWSATKQWADPQFIPYPATFLNQRRWAEVPTEAALPKPDEDVQPKTRDIRKADGWMYRQQIDATGNVVYERRRDEVARIEPENE